MEACCEPPCTRVPTCASVVLEAGLPDPASSCLSSCLASIDRRGGPRHLLGRPFGDQVVPLPCAAIRAEAALPTAIPSFSEILDAASLCDTAYARAENDGEFGPCHWVVGECRNAREMFCQI